MGRVSQDEKGVPIWGGYPKKGRVRQVMGVPQGRLSCWRGPCSRRGLCSHDQGFMLQRKNATRDCMRFGVLCFNCRRISGVAVVVAKVPYPWSGAFLCLLLLELLLAFSPLALIQQPATASAQLPYKVVYRA